MEHPESQRPDELDLAIAALFPTKPEHAAGEIAAKIFQVFVDFTRFICLWMEEAWPDILRATRSWLQYGTVGFAVLCIVIGAVEAVFGR